MSLPSGSNQKNIKTIYQTGFPKVFLGNIKVHGKTLEKGKKLTASQHVHDVKQVNYDDGSIEIIGKVIREMTVRENFTVTIQLDPETREITRAHCPCVGGSDGQCKHFVAVFNYVNEERDELKTDKLQTWHEPSQYAQQLYRTGEDIESIMNVKPKFKTHNFASMSEESKRKHIEIMEKVGNTKCTLYKYLTTKVEFTNYLNES